MRKKSSKTKTDSIESVESKKYLPILQRGLKQRVIDTLYINSAEKILERPLSIFEEHKLRNGDLIFVKNRNSIWFSFQSRFYTFPDDFVPPWVDVSDTNHVSYFEEFFGDDEDIYD